jgi:hypothetical protein
MELLLRTVHGSRLYGLSHAGSDYDYFEVYGWDKFRGKQKVKDGDDRTRQSYDRFMRYCEKGVPQYLEALWSTKADVDNFPFNRFGYGLNYVNVRETYMRTIKNFWLSGCENDSFKLRRHAARLAMNLTEIYYSGRFNPTLSFEERLIVEALATSKDPEDIPEVL